MKQRLIVYLRVNTITIKLYFTQSRHVSTSALTPYALENGGESTAAEMREPATSLLVLCARNEQQRAAFRPSGITRLKSFNNGPFPTPSAEHKVIACLTGMASVFGSGGRMFK
jgi:hypothetical protein